MELWEVRIELECAEKLLLGIRPLKVVGPGQPTQTEVGLGESLVQLQGPHRRLSGIRHRLFGAENPRIAEKVIGLGDASVGEGVLGIAGLRLLKVLEPLQGARAPQVDEVPALEVQVVGFEVLRRRPDELLRHAGGERNL